MFKPSLQPAISHVHGPTESSNVGDVFYAKIPKMEQQILELYNIRPGKKYSCYILRTDYNIRKGGNPRVSQYGPNFGNKTGLKLSFHTSDIGW